MARKIRFPLKMANGADVRSLEEFIENFDLESALGYYEDGKLITWLRDRYHDTEADKLEALDKTAKSFTSDFCAVFGIEAAADDAESGADIDYIARRNEKKRILRTITDDESVIYNVDTVALDQDDLLDIFDEGKKEIYLCQGEFEIPLSVTGVTYHGIADPVVTVRVTDNVNFNEKNIKFVDCVYGWDVSKTSPLDNMKRAEHLFLKGDYQKSAGILETYAEQGNPRAVMLLCHIYKELLPDNTKFKYWSEKAKQSCEVCNVIDCIENNAELTIKTQFEQLRKMPAEKNNTFVFKHGESDTKKYFTILKKLADKGDAFNEYYYASALYRYEQYLDNEKHISELIEFYRTQYKEINKYYTLSAEKGNVAAMNCLGRSLGGDEAVSWYIKAAEMGSITAMKKVGNAYRFGHGSKAKDQAKAVEWYSKAAEKSDIEALNLIGDCYYGTDDAKKFDYYLQAAKLGYIDAMWSVAFCYKYGEGVDQDDEKYLYWLTKGAEQGYNSYQFTLGEALCSDEWYQDHDKGVKWLTKSSENGDFNAALKLACYYHENDNDDKAFEIIRSAADNGDPNAQNILGNIFYKGTLSADENCEEAVSLYKKAVENNSKNAIYNLAFCYYNGKGVHQSYEKACELLIEAMRKDASFNSGELDYSFDNIFDEDEIDYEKFFDLYKGSAEKGNAKAQCMLGDLWFYYGWLLDDDYDQNYEKSAIWYAKSADQGNVAAQRQMAGCYLDGNGVEKNEEQGLDWLIKAAKNGDTESLEAACSWLDYDEYRNKIDIVLPIAIKAAEKGNEDSAGWLGSYYEDKGDIEKAIEWYTKAQDISAIKRIILSSNDLVTN